MLTDFEIAYHEAAHAVVALALHWAVTSITISPCGDDLGVCGVKRDTKGCGSRAASMQLSRAPATWGRCSPGPVGVHLRLPGN